MKTNLFSLVRRAFQKPHRRLLVVLIISSILWTIAYLMIPALFEFGLEVIEHSIETSTTLDFGAMMMFFGIALGSSLISGIFQWCTHYFAYRLSLNLCLELREEVFDVIMKAPISYLDAHSIGVPLELLTSASEVIHEALEKLFVEVLHFVIMLIVALVMMFIRIWILALAVLFIAPLIVLASYLLAKKSTKASHRYQEALAQFNVQSEEFVTKQKLFIAYDYRANKIEELEATNKNIGLLSEKSQFLASLVNPMTRFINYLIYAMIAISASFMFLDGGIKSISVIVGFMAYAREFAHPFDRFSELMSFFVSGNVAAKRVYNFINNVSLEGDDLPFKEDDIAKNGEIEFRHVSFNYEKGPNLLKDFSLKVKPKTKIAIVGPTGAGKSTVFNLLLRFFDDYQGSIFVDQKETRTISKKALRQSFGLVLQDTWLFDGTILENIRYSKPDATMEEVIEACKKANCHEDIIHLPNGYNTYLFEGDNGVSLGQKQLITIARALLNNPPILLLDEATSNIDSISEMEIQKTLVEIMKEHTTFFVAHHLNTIVDSDLILVLKDGELIETGTHEELLIKDGFYAKLYHIQND